MPLPARLTIILLAALLTACAGRSPVLEPSGVPPEPVSATAANDVLFRALGLVGTPYRYGGNTPDSGFDCSGLIGYVYRDAAGLALPRTTQQMSQAQGANVRREALQAGDLVFFATSGGRRVSHAGIYVAKAVSCMRRPVAAPFASTAWATATGTRLILAPSACSATPRWHATLDVAATASPD